MTMYERIRELRIMKGLSQLELARLTGYHDRSSIAKIESGNVDLPQSKILSFAAVLGVSPAQLMGLEDEAPSSSMLRVSDHERELIVAYRSKPEMQLAVDKLLGLDAVSLPQPKQA